MQWCLVQPNFDDRPADIARLGTNLFDANETITSPVIGCPSVAFTH